MTTPLLQLDGLSKAFGATRALDDVSIELGHGEVMGLIGRNGSGKSTLIKILSGFHAPDAGTLHVRGAAVAMPIQPDTAHRVGLSFVHQDLGLLPEFSVVENLRVGRYRTRSGGLIDWPRERRIVGDALAHFGVRATPNTLVGALPVVDRALVAIVRALLDFEKTEGAEGHEASTGVLVLDEPTAYLPRDGVERLFSAVRSVAAAGTGVIFVSHRLDEVMAITDRVAVLRDGRLVGNTETASVNEDQLIELLLGRAMEDFYPEQHAQRGEQVLKVEDLNGVAVRDVNLVAHRGEIIGLTGLAGAGHEEVPYLLFGATRAVSGTMQTVGKKLPAASMSPRLAMDNGIALLPADRQRASGCQEATVAENLSLPVLDSFSSGGRVQKKPLLRRVSELLAEFDVRPADPTRRMNQLSGGNQQKGLLGKWMQRNPPVLLLHEPTQGVDVGSKKEIFAKVQAAADAGATVIISSVEYEDLANLCHRVLVFRDGRVAAELRGEELSEDRLINESFRTAARSDVTVG
jgi:ribose transport system ATP-binding protein